VQQAYHELSAAPPQSAPGIARHGHNSRPTSDELQSYELRSDERIAVGVAHGTTQGAQRRPHISRPRDLGASVESR
jgi:hypothetical protein